MVEASQKASWKGGRYKNVAIPIDLANRIEKALEEHPEWGYRSLSEFVNDAARRRIEELEKLIAEYRF